MLGLETGGNAGEIGAATGVGEAKGVGKDGTGGGGDGGTEGTAGTGGPAGAGPGTGLGLGVAPGTGGAGKLSINYQDSEKELSGASTPFNHCSAFASFRRTIAVIGNAGGSAIETLAS